MHSSDGMKTYRTGPEHAKDAILVVYDIFGFFPQTIQGADILAHADKEHQYQVNVVIRFPLCRMSNCPRSTCPTSLRASQSQLNGIPQTPYVTSRWLIFDTHRNTNPPIFQYRKRRARSLESSFPPPAPHPRRYRAFPRWSRRSTASIHPSTRGA